MRSGPENRVSNKVCTPCVAAGPSKRSGQKNDPSPARSATRTVPAMAAAPDLVLVHGAFHGPWAWDVLRPHLHDRGLATHVVALPSSGGQGGLAADAAALADLLDAVPGPKIVVGHSYGGQVISQGCAGRADVAGLVYLAAFLLDVGDSVFSASATLDAAPDGIWIDIDEATGTATVSDPVDRFYADADPELTTWAQSRLTSQTLASLADALTAAAWREVPSTYIATTNDRAIPFAVQQVMAKNAATVHAVESSHSPFLSMPERVADILADAVRTRQKAT